MSKFEIDEYGDTIYRNDKDRFHREDGPAIETSDGDKYWYINGSLHRENGPAIEYRNGYKGWYINGIRHRADGPACQGTHNQSWFYYGKEIECDSQEEFLRLIKLKGFW